MQEMFRNIQQKVLQVFDIDFHILLTVLKLLFPYLILQREKPRKKAKNIYNYVNSLTLRFSEPNKNLLNNL